METHLSILEIVTQYTMIKENKLPKLYLDKVQRTALNSDREYLNYLVMEKKDLIFARCNLQSIICLKDNNLCKISFVMLAKLQKLEGILLVLVMMARKYLSYYKKRNKVKAYQLYRMNKKFGVLLNNTTTIRLMMTKAR